MTDPAGEGVSRPVHGAEVEEEGVRFSVWGPDIDGVSIRMGSREHRLASSPDGFWRGFVAGARPGDPYWLVLPDGRALPDPSSRRQPQGVHGPSQVFDAGAYRWRHPLAGPALEELIFYEVHVGTFTPEGTLDAAALRLADLRDLGVTCVELMPVQPFSGKRNWGYDGVAPYAVHEGYGGPPALQRFVDEAHGLGLAVCLDVVFNHLGPEGNYLSAFGPYFTKRHRTPWGDGINYDGEGSLAVRSYLLGAALQWVRDFRIDALRLDAVHAIVDDSPRHFVSQLCEEVAGFAAASGRRIHVVAESDLEDRKVVDPPPRGWGCSAMWADDFHHAVHALLTGERHHYYADFGGMDRLERSLAEGFAFRDEPSAFRGKRWGSETSGLEPCRFVFCTQNHDQVGNRPRGERLAALIAFEALTPLATLLALGPALPLLFMGEEYGEDRPFLYFTSFADPVLARAVSEGRKSEHIARVGNAEVPDPQAPETFRRSVLTHSRDGKYGELRRHFRAMLQLRRRHARNIATGWPMVSVAGTSVALRRPGLLVAANLGPDPAGGLPGFGWRVSEG
ncbi:MAG TPA: malto-oligosyltrehalose trehalohydrolase [Anaeromyxobacteraceae bacterium]|nr:malto-oligosyltrehalose trehalohydrolase [Anaeromyxobacteraceae bacterium]